VKRDPSVGRGKNFGAGAHIATSQKEEDHQINSGTRSVLSVEGETGKGKVEGKKKTFLAFKKEKEGRKAFTDASDVSLNWCTRGG